MEELREAQDVNQNTVPAQATVSAPDSSKKLLSAKQKSDMKIAETVFKWIIFGLFVLYFILYFIPMFHIDYDKYYLMYSGGIGRGYNFISVGTILFPIFVLIFLFARFKNSKLFFFGMSAIVLFDFIVILKTIMEVVKASKYNGFEPGFYVLFMTIVLMFIAIAAMAVLYIIGRINEFRENKSLEPESVENAQAEGQTNDVPALINKLNVLNDLLKGGVINEDEYNEKRAEIVNNFKL